MAKIKNFSDFNGQCVELAYVTSIPNQEFAARFPGVKGLRYDGYSMWVGRETATSPRLPVTRKIEYKSQPSRHECKGCVVIPAPEVVRGPRHARSVLPRPGRPSWPAPGNRIGLRRLPRLRNHFRKYGHGRHRLPGGTQPRPVQFGVVLPGMRDQSH